MVNLGYGLSMCIIAWDITGIGIQTYTCVIAILCCFKVAILPIGFQISTLVSALGGALSLYLGISVAMFFEVIELLIDILINLCMTFAGKTAGRKMRTAV